MDTKDNTWPPKALGRVDLCATGKRSGYSGVSCYRKPRSYGKGPTNQECRCSLAYLKYITTFKHQYNYGYIR